MSIRRLRKSSGTTQILCRECRGPISPDATVCNLCHAPVVRRYCPRCSKLVPETTEFCPYCGTSAKANVKRIPATTILLVLGILGTTLYLAVNISKHKDSEPAEKVSANSPASKPPHSSPVHEKQVVQKPVMASPQQTGIDEQKGAELNMKAHKLITEGRYAEAIPMLEQALKTFPKNSTAPAYKFVLYNLGHSLRRVGRTKEAVPYLDRCVKIDSEWEKARTELQIALATTQTTQ